MIINHNYHITNFIKSAPNVKDLSLDEGSEVAIMGYSNSGKSSILNTLTNQYKLANVSNVPGRTKYINIFEIASSMRLVDFPGYGYAKISKKKQQQWQYNINEYLQKRKSLKGVVLSVDIRRLIRHLDMQIIQWSLDLMIPVLILLTKSDKIKRETCTYNLFKTRESLLIYNSNILHVNTFSSFKKKGVDNLQYKLNSWFINHF